MAGILRACATIVAIALLAPSSAPAGDKDTISQLTQVVMKASSDDVVVTISGSQAPNFTSFTKNDPFRVVVDWAGSRLSGVAEEKKFERGLIRRIHTKQYDSEAETISRVTIELARETSYHVEAEGKRVLVHFTPVPDPIQEPAPEPASAEQPKKIAEAVPEGPLTEPAVDVPQQLPPIVRKETAIAQAPAPVPAAKTAPAPAPAPAPVVVASAKTTPPVMSTPPPAETTPPIAPKTAPPTATQVAAVQPAPVPATPAKTEPAKTEPAKPVTVAKIEPPPAAPAPVAKTEPAKTEPAKPVTVAKVEPAKPVEVAKNEPARTTPPTLPVKAEPAKTEPAKTAEPVRLATFAPPALPVAAETKPLPSAKSDNTKPAVALETPAAKPHTEMNAETQRFASNIPSTRERASQWTPPSIPLPAEKKKLPIVKLASAQDGAAPLQPQSKLPADPDEPAAADAQQKTVDEPSKDANEFDPGPRVMKYIGFQQMADVSRVFVRLDGKAKYKSMKEGGSKFVLELSNTSINVKNNERPLDTTYFNTPVQKVQATKQGDATRIEVKLKESVPYKVQRIGNTIAIDFQRAK